MDHLRVAEAGLLTQAHWCRLACTGGPDGLKYEQAQCRIIMMMHVKIFILPAMCAIKLQIETEVNGYVMYLCLNLQLDYTNSGQNKILAYIATYLGLMMPNIIGR